MATVNLNTAVSFEYTVPLSIDTPTEGMFGIEVLNPDSSRIIKRASDILFTFTAKIDYVAPVAYVAPSVDPVVDEVLEVVEVLEVPAKLEFPYTFPLVGSYRMNVLLDDTTSITTLITTPVTVINSSTIIKMN